MTDTNDEKRRRNLASVRKYRAANAERLAAARQACEKATHPCECGCGTDVSGTATFALGHQNRPCRSPTEYGAYVTLKKERDAAYQAKWRADNREHKNAYQREYMKDPERVAKNKAYALTRYHANPDVAWERNLAKKYGLTADDYFAMLKAQGDGCAICGDFKPGGRPREDGTIRLAVDHCHTTGKVRGLLCRRCNVVIGKTKDDPELLSKAIGYLKKHAAP